MFFEINLEIWKKKLVPSGTDAQVEHICQDTSFLW